MAVYAVIGHYFNTSHFCEMVGWPGRLLRFLPDRRLKDVIQVLPPYRFLDMPEMRSDAGSTAKGFIFIVPMLPEHTLTLPEEVVFQKILATCRMAERAGVQIAGLAGFTSIVSDQGRMLADRVGIALTSGNTLTSAMALQGMRRAAGRMGLCWEEARVAVIGASGDIGSACARVLSQEVRGLILAARDEQGIKKVVSSFGEKAARRTTITKYVRDAVRAADVILSATSALTTVIDPDDLKPGAIVCDVALPHSVATDVLLKRDDVLVFEGGMAKLPYCFMKPGKRSSLVSSDGRTIFGCFAEAMLLALDGRTDNRVVGRGNILPQHIAEIDCIAGMHGFEVADFRYQGVTFTDDKLRNIVARAATKKSGWLFERNQMQIAG